MKSSPFLLVCLLVACHPENNARKIAVEYPETKKIDHIDEYWGEEVADPYRWLEDDYAEDTKGWVSSQNEITFGYLEQIPFREKIRSRLEEVWNYEKISAPFSYGDYTYYFKNDGLQNQSVLYRKQGEGAEEVFLDPNQLSDDETSSLSSYAFTNDGRLFAYAVSLAGSDWRDIMVMDTETMTLLDDKIVDAKFTNISWKGKEGFYYSTYKMPGGNKLSALTNDHRLYFHRLGMDQKEDQLVFGSDDAPRRYVFGDVTEDGQYLIVGAANNTYGNEVYFQDQTIPNAPMILMVDNMENNHTIVDHRDGKFFIATNLNAPNNKLAITKVSDPHPENWNELIPETENVLEVSKGGGKLFATYLKDAISEVLQVACWLAPS